MKYILITLSGASDVPVEELSGKTPFEVAKLPNLHSFAKMGKVGQVKLVSDRLEPTGDVAFLNLLGYDADQVYTGLAPLEAANLELKLEDDEIPFRMNFITEASGVLADPGAGGIASKESKALINFLNKKVASDFVRFFAGPRQHHIAVLKDSHGFEALSAKTSAPDSIIGEKIEDYLPKGPGGELLKKLMFDAKLLLQDHEINQVRVDLQENPANMIWLWGQGPKPSLKKFKDLFDCSGAVISDAEYARGIGRLSGLTVHEVNGKEDLSAYYEKAGKVLLEALEEKDFVCIHLEDCDLAGAQGDLRAKISAMEACDFFVLSKVKSYLEETKDVRVLFTPAYALPWKTRKRVRESVPFVMVGKNIVPGDTERFSEAAARTSDIKIGKSSELMSLFLLK